MAEKIPHWLTKQAYLAPDKPAIEMVDGEMITFLQLKEKSQILARKLASLGIKKGDHIGILSTNHPQIIMAIHALSYLGAVSVLLNRRLSTHELAYQLTDAHVAIVITCDDAAEQLSDSALSVQSYTYSDVRKLAPTNMPLKEEIDLTEPFTMMYTSGTTGTPKGVIHTYNNYWWSAIGSALNLGLQADDKWLAVLPMFHIGGLAIFIRSVIYGMTVLLMNTFDAKQANDLIQSRKVTIMSAVTLMLREMITAREGKPYPETFRCLLLGGGSAPVSLLKQAERQKIPVFQSYGLTETSSQLATLSPEVALQKIGSAGKPLFPGQLKISKPDSEGIGEILVKGPMVINHYYGLDPDDESFPNGWLATGDVGYLDDEGYLYVVDRRTDLIISGGENVYPAEIENVLSGLEKVEEVGVAGKQDDQWGHVPVAFIKRKDDSLTEEAVLAYAQDHLAAYKIPKEIFFMESLPRNASHKIKRYALTKLLKEGSDDFHESPE